MRGSESIPLRPKTWSVLRFLAERPGVLITKEELLDAVWSDVTVTESVMSKSIGELRVVLGDSSKTPRFIETVQRRGFRFIAPISRHGSAVSEPSSVPTYTDFGLPGPRLFVGRNDELQRLETLFAKARSGERQLVFITGPAGIGKTALVEAFLGTQAVGEAASVWIARASCVEQHGPHEAYMPVIDALERLARRPEADRLGTLLRRLAPTWLAQVPWLIGDGEMDGLRRSLQVVRPERMLREFAALIEALTADVTLVLVLEDLHWSDASSVDLLSYLGERRELARLLVIGTYCPADAIVREHTLMNAVRTMHVRRHCVDLPLCDLTPEAVRSYLQARFPGSDFPPTLARLIHKHTDGNPLFLVAAIDHLLSRGHILDTEPGWALVMPPEKIDLGVPDDVGLLIENHLDGLNPDDRELLQAASVAGDDFTPLVVAAALGKEVADIEMRCEAFAHAQRFLRVAGQVEWPDHGVSRRYAFIHELYRQVVYRKIPEGHCMRLHQRIGRALEAAYGARQMEIAPQLAVHFERGRDAARAVHYLAAAGASARQRFANREAIDYLETALALVERSSEEGERCRLELQLRLQLGVALSTVHGFASQRVRENYERASELCTKVGSATQLFDVQYARWYLHAIHGDRDKAIAIAAELESLARRLRTPEHWLLADSVQVRTALYDGRFAETSRRMQRLLARQRRRKPAAAAVAYGADPLIAATSHCAMALWFLGHPERAQTSARAAIAQARESGHSFTLTAVLMQAALVNLLCRNPVEGGDLACEAVAVSVEHGFAFWNAVTSLLTGWALVQQGQASEGGAAIERALDAMQATGTRFFSAFAYAFLAEARLHTGALDDGVTAADAGLAVANSTLDRAYEPELWRLKGELLEEKSKVESSKPQARRVKVGYGRPGTAEQALACFQRALDLARAAEAKSLELRAATSLARAWRVRGRTADARKVLSGVCKWFGKGAGTADLGEARTLLAEL